MDQPRLYPMGHLHRNFDLQMTNLLHFPEAFGPDRQEDLDVDQLAHKFDNAYRNLLKFDRAKLHPFHEAVEIQSPKNF